MLRVGLNLVAFVVFRTANGYIKSINLAHNGNRLFKPTRALFLSYYTASAYQKLCFTVLGCSWNVTGMCPSAAQFTAQFF